MELIVILFFGIPIAAIWFLIHSICRYVSLRWQEKAGEAEPDRPKKQKLLLILSILIAGTLVAAVLGFVIVMGLAIAFM